MEWWSDTDTMPTLPKSLRQNGVVSQALQSIVGQIPRSAEPGVFEPKVRAQTIAKSAAFRAAALSGTMSLPPGPLGLATVIPDLIAVWRLQQQLVADIAAVFGKTAHLTPETMTVCLFSHGHAELMNNLVQRSSSRVLIRRVAKSTLHLLLGKIAVRVSRRLAVKGLSRWLPVVGALGVGAYAYHETQKIAAKAIALFSNELGFARDPAAPSPPPLLLPKPFRQARRKPKTAASTRKSRRRQPA